MKKFKFTFKIVLVAIVLSGTAYSQSVRSAFFSMTEVGSGNKSIVRSYKPTGMLITSSFSSTDQVNMFTFIKNSTTLNYTPLPYGYVINDFVILDSCIYFCGRNAVKNCGYIGMFNVPTPYQGIGAYTFIDIDSAANLTKLVAYNGTSPSSIGIVAIGTPKNTSFTSCIVDLNNYSSSSNNGWKYYYGHITGEEITDICDASADLLVTVGKPKAVSSGNGMVALPSKLYLRTYKKAGVLISGMENERREYSTFIPSAGGGFLVEPVDGNDVAIVGVQGFGKDPIVSYFLDILKININSLYMHYGQTITLSEDYLGGLVELEYFPNTKELGIVLNKGDNIGELILADITKIVDYAPYKLWRSNYLFNSIVRANNDNFALTCKPVAIAVSSRLQILHENLNTFSESNCTTDAIIQAEVKDVSKYSTMQINNFTTDSKNATFTFSLAAIYETNVEIHCINYYK